MRRFVGTIRFAVFLACFSACFAIGILSIAHAQTSARPAPSNDAAPDPAAASFDALPEADRKAIQDGLVWTGDYQGTVDGRFGKGTRKAIIAFATRLRLPDDGTLDAKGRAKLVGLAAQAKRAMRFSIMTDARNGMKIGVPLRLLSKSAATKTGTRYFSADRSAALETEMTPESAGNDSKNVERDASGKPVPTFPHPALAQKFDAARLESRNRKVTYKILRPDFYVVAGESAGHQFYSRAARGIRNGMPVIIGFTFTYPAAAKPTYEALVIAAANSFDPFPGQTVSATPPPAVMTTVMANGIAVGKGLILASLPANGCRAPKIRGEIVKISKQDGDLALLETAGLSATPVALRMQPPAAPADVVVMSFVAKKAREGVAAAEPASELMATPGTLLTHVAAPGLRVLAAPQGAIAGSPVFDRTGALIGLLLEGKAPVKHIGDIVPATSWSLLDAARLAAFLGAQKPREAEGGVDRSLGDIVMANRTALVPIFCGP